MSQQGRRVRVIKPVFASLFDRLRGCHSRLAVACECRTLVPRILVRHDFELRLVRSIRFAVPCAVEEPAETTATGLDDIPRVKCVEESTCWAVSISLWRFGRQGIAALWKRLVTLSKVVRMPWESIEMEDSKYGHFHASQHGRNTDPKVRSCNLIGSFERTTLRGQKGDDPALPEAEEDDKLDAKNLHKGPMWGKIVLELNVELYQTVHGNRDRYGVEAGRPDIRVARVLGAHTISTLGLSDD